MAVLSGETQAWLDEVQESADTLAELILTLDGLRQTFDDRGYAAGITDTDLDDSGYPDFTDAQLDSMMNLANELKNLRDNAAVTQGDWGATISALRNFKKS